MSIGTPKTVKTPPADLRERLPELAPLIDEVASFRDRLTAERQNLVELEHQLAAADEQDVQAAADALRSGGADPGRKASTKAQKAIDQQKPVVAALARAVLDAEEDLLSKLEEVAETRRQDLLEDAEAERAAARRTVETLTDQVLARSQTLALRTWLANPLQELNPLKHAGHRVEALTQPNGEAPTLLTVIGETAAALDPPQAPAPSNPAGGHGEHLTVAG